MGTLQMDALSQAYYFIEKVEDLVARQTPNAQRRAAEIRTALVYCAFAFEEARSLLRGALVNEIDDAGLHRPPARRAYWALQAAGPSSRMEHPGQIDRLEAALTVALPRLGIRPQAVTMLRRCRRADVELRTEARRLDGLDIEQDGG